MHLRTLEDPVLTREDIPEISTALTDVSGVFNPGAAVWCGQAWLVLRVQDRGRRSYMIAAKTDLSSPEKVEAMPYATEIVGLDEVKETVYHTYDPRLTVLDGELYLVFAADCEGCCRLGVAKCVSEDLSRFELISFDPEGDSRNGVLFPEKIGGKYVRLERPNGIGLSEGPTSGDTVFWSTSEDLVTWELQEPVFGGRWHFWDERIGSGPPPVKISPKVDSPYAGQWLHLYHGIATHFASSNIYQGGAVVLAAEEPGKLLARTPMNLLEPREPWELSGQVGNVVFPSAQLCATNDDGSVNLDTVLHVYYGAADTVVGLATATIGEILAACE